MEILIETKTKKEYFDYSVIDMFDDEDMTHPYSFYSCVASVVDKETGDYQASNYGLTEMMKKHGVIKEHYSEDTESGGVGVYFKTKDDAHKFVDDLNVFLNTVIPFIKEVNDY